MESGKIDPALVYIPQPESLDPTVNDINVGLDVRDDTWEVIVKYNGDLNVIVEPLNADVEILNNSYAIVTLPEQNINRLTDYNEVEFVERPKTLGIVQGDNLIKTCISSVQRDPVLNLNGRGVIVAILDSGIDYAHPDFLDVDGNTRILRIWDQTIDGNPPAGFKDGSEYTEDDINEALAAPNIGERISIVPSIDYLGHGTGVAGIACGNTGVATESDILVVKIGRNIDRGFARTTELMRGIKYVIDFAEALNRPISINISFGTNDGPHDGRSLFETFIDDISQQWKTNITVASGNEGDAAKHYEGILSQGETLDIEFSIANNLQTLAITFWKSFADKFTFEIISPQGVSTGLINFSSDLRRFVFSSSILYISFGQPTPYNVDQEIYLQFVAMEGLEISSGIWTLRLGGASIVQGNFNLWLPITEISTRGTYFLSPDAARSLTLPSTALSVITVGSYNSTINSASSFSGRGYTRTFNVVKPDLVAPGNSILTASTNGGYTPRTGTSFAAPHVAGAVALLMQWGIVENNDQFLYGQKTKAYLQLGARREDTRFYPNNQWGYGTLCLANSVNFLRQYITLPTRSGEIIGVNLNKNAFAAMEVGNDNNEIVENNETSVNQIISEDYSDLIVRNNDTLDAFVEQNGNNTYNNKLLSVYGILSINNSILDEFNESVGIQVVKEMPMLVGLMGREDLEAAGILNVQNQPFLSLRGSGTLVGIIDTGITYTNEAFIYEDNTSKIDFLWDQTIESDNPPEDFSYGTEYTNADINEAINSENPLEVVPHTDDVGHGTFLASVSCGREEADINYIGAAPDANLIVVKLKPAKKYIRDYYAIGDNVDNVYQSNDIMTAIEYIRLRAIELQKPVAICLGLGSSFGGHDGSSLFEEYISTISIRTGLIMVVAAGDEGRNRGHFVGEIEQTGDRRSIELRVGDNEPGVSLLVYANESDKLSVSITSPTEEVRKRNFKVINKRKRIESNLIWDSILLFGVAF